MRLVSLTSYDSCYVVNRYQIPDDWPYQGARQLFKEPLVCTDEEQLDIKWTTPDEEVIYLFWFKVFSQHTHIITLKF